MPGVVGVYQAVEALPDGCGVDLVSGGRVVSPGSNNPLDLAGGLPGTTTHFVFGLSPLDAPFKGGTLAIEQAAFDGASERLATGVPGRAVHGGRPAV